METKDKQKVLELVREIRSTILSRTVEQSTRLEEILEELEKADLILSEAADSQQDYFVVSLLVSALDIGTLIPPKGTTGMDAFVDRNGWILSRHFRRLLDRDLMLKMALLLYIVRNYADETDRENCKMCVRNFRNFEASEQYRGGSSALNWIED